MRTKAGIVALLIGFLAVVASTEAEEGPLKPSPKDKCPVCGMFVAKYPDWVGEIIFKDGSAAFFDGAKDLFKYYFNLKKVRRKSNSINVPHAFFEIFNLLITQN